jgi:hypothetical protein
MLMLMLMLVLSTHFENENDYENENESCLVRPPAQDTNAMRARSSADESSVSRSGLLM